MNVADLAALGAALCWAAGGLIAVGPVRAIGSVAFNRVRMVVVFAMLAAAVTLTGGWHTLDTGGALLLALSGAVGIVIGDTALFWALGRIGPRRNTVIYAANAPLTAVLAWVLLGERLGPWAAAGIALVTAGVMLAVFFRVKDTAVRPADGWETVSGGLLAGVAAALTAALCQAIGSIIAKPALAAGVDPAAGAAVRVGTAAAMMLASGFLPGQRLALGEALRPAVLLPILANGFVGLGLGMTLLMIGLRHGNTGVVATLSATSPVLILPMLWALTRRAPHWGAWAGAGLAVTGVALIVNG